MKSARYEQSFKIEAVKRVVVDGQSISGAAREVGVTVTSLRNWIGKYGSQLDAVESPHCNNESLKKRLKQVIRERDALKATLLILLKDQAQTPENI